MKEDKKKIKKRFGDRYDGRRIRKGDPLNVITPFLMVQRADSQVFFDAEVDVSKIDELVKEKRKNGVNIGFLDYLVAILVRTISQYPRLNRFIAGKRLYARDDLRISLVVKKEMKIEADETSIKFKFDRDNTVDEINHIIRGEIEKNKGEPGKKNDTDSVVGILNMLPRFLLSFVVGTLKMLDYFGYMPKLIHEVSPMHTSVFVTNFGSLGADPIYHHIYNFGTTSIFIAFGNKKVQRMINKDGKMVTRKVIKMRFVADERIADGYYLAKSLQYFVSLFQHPEIVEVKPEHVFEDDQI